MKIEYAKPPAEEISDRPALPRKAARIALEELPERKIVLVVNDDNDIHFGDDQSTPTFISVIKDMGYDVKFEKANETIYTTWKRYNIVVWSCGDDYSVVNTTKYRQMLVEYVDKGGCLLLESGNVAAWAKEFGGEIFPNRMFREKVLHVTGDWVYHDVGDLILKNNHPIATTPNALPETIGFTPTNPGDNSGDANAVRILDDATGIYNWSSVAYENMLLNESIAEKSYGLIAYESKEKNGGRIVYFAFDIDDIEDADIQQKLIENSVNWLKVKEEEGMSKIGGEGRSKISEKGKNQLLCSMPKVPERVLPMGIDTTRARLINILDKKWVIGTVLPYCFLNEPAKFKGAEEQKKVVRDGFNVWKNVGIGVKFEEVSNPDDAQILIGFLQDDGTWSLVGRDIRNEDYKRELEGRTMNFGWDLIMEDRRGVDTATHEIGHTLGFPHEHQNPNAGIEWNEDAVYEFMRRTQIPPWDKATTDHNIINKIPPDKVQGSSWDPDSIMHYPFAAGLINKPQQYRNGLTPAGGLSERDITWAKTFYSPKVSIVELTVDTPVQLALGPGEQKDFTFEPEETRTYNIATSGESDTVMVLFELKNKKRIQLAANDDSAEDFNSNISWKLVKGKKYVISIRLYHEWVKGDTTVKIW